VNGKELFQSSHLNKMKDSNFKNVEASGAVYGIQIGLTMLLAICLAAYDGLEHSYPILIGYMLIVWVIPLALWRFVKKIVSSPVSSVRSNINLYGLWIVGITLGILFFLLSIFLPSSLIDSIKVNGETITNCDPRFAKDILQFRFEFGGIGLFFAGVSYFILRKRRKNNQVQKSE
jgi:hypothetical protein